MQKQRQLATTIDIQELSGCHFRERPVVEFNLQNPTAIPELPRPFASLTTRGPANSA